MAAGPPSVPPTTTRIARSPWRRLYLGQTAVDFWGRRRWWLLISGLAIVASIVSLVISGLTLGIDFRGGVAWDVPAAQLSVEDARGILDDNGIEGADAKIQERRSDSGDIIKVQVEDQPAAVRIQLQEAFAEAAGVDPAEVSVSSVSSTWGWEITKKAIWALAVYLTLIALFISLRFEWRMALSAILAMLHDVLISVGIYSIFGFEVTPATVIAFLTILGYSLYDTIVVFDKVKENERRLAAAGLTAGDLVNVSVNQVLLRSLNTTISAVLPVISLLLIGSGLFGQVTLREFALALLVGMLTGAYSSLFVASPLLGWFKARSARFAARSQRGDEHLVGDDLRRVVVAGIGAARPAGRRAQRASSSADVPDGEPAATAPVGAEVAADRLLSHPPRPRKKKRR
jgi:preprotein translocase subunit SecF